MAKHKSRSISKKKKLEAFLTPFLIGLFLLVFFVLYISPQISQSPEFGQGSEDYLIKIDSSFFSEDSRSIATFVVPQNVRNVSVDLSSLEDSDVEKFVNFLEAENLGFNSIVQGNSDKIYSTKAPKGLKKIVLGSEGLRFSYDLDYIIEFKTLPVIEADSKGLVGQKIEEYGVNLVNEREGTLSDLRQRLKSEVSLDSDIVVKDSFSKVFNGILVESLTSSEINEIKSHPNVLNVYPDNVVNANLVESVPLIRANSVWEDGYTGEGVSIAIIDTGVDYTHPDLGGCFGEKDVENDASCNLDNICSNSEGVVSEEESIVVDYNDENYEIEIDFIDTDSVAFLVDGDSTDDLAEGDSEKLTIGEYIQVISIDKIAIAGSIGSARFRIGENSDICPSDCSINPFENSCKVVGGYDFVNDDDDPMDDHGHGTHVAATAAGWNGGDLDSESEERSSFEFSVVGHAFSSDSINMNLEFKDGSRDMGILFGDDEFEGIGEDVDRRLAYSDNGDITFFEQVSGSDYHTMLVASHNTTNDAESYLLSFDVTEDSSNARNETSIKNLVTGETLVTDKKAGDTFDIGDVRLNIIAVHRNSSDRWVELSAGENVRFDIVFDKDGNYVELFDIEDFPSDEKELVVYNGLDEEIDEYEFKMYDWGIDITLKNKDKSNNGNNKNTGGNSPGVLNGVAPFAEVYAYKVLNSWGSGSFSNVIAAIEMAVDPNGDGDFSDRVDIISMSLGMGCSYYGYMRDYCGPNDPQSKAVDNAVNSGVVVVISAGNSGHNSPRIGSPGTARKALTVGATDKNDVIAGFSSGGPVQWPEGAILKPDVMAPGVNICAAQWEDAWSYSECLDGEHTSISGTSMSAPHVAGLAALVIQKYPELSSEEVKYLIKGSSIDLGYPLHHQGVGRIDVPRTLFNDVLIYGDLDYGILQKEDSLVRSLIVKNLVDEERTLKFEASLAKNLEGVSLDVVDFSDSEIVLLPGQELELQVSLDLSNIVEGFFSGMINVQSDESSSNLSYSFAKFTYLNLNFEGDHYPNFYIHDENGYNRYSALQGFSFEGNAAPTIIVKPGNYTIYAVSDPVNPLNPYWYPEKDMYILQDTVEIFFGETLDYTFSLNNAKELIVKTDSLEGKTLDIFDWYYAFDIENIENGMRSRVSFHTLAKGSQKMYVNNKPDNGWDTDIIIKYGGVPIDG